MPRDPYEATGRWEEYGDGIFRLKDRKGADYLLAPTHEEAFTLLVKDLYGSYKDLPLTIYQIQDKYRDEARPRAGLLRGREFTMKDAYSFDYTDAGLDTSYMAQRDAYERIFQRLGLEYVIVQADAGAMGGSRSEEFLHPTAIGEDTFVRSAGGYAANVEAFETLAPEPIAFDGFGEPVIFDSPNTPTIETLVAHTNAVLDGEYTAADTLKNVVLALTHSTAAASSSSSVSPAIATSTTSASRWRSRRRGRARDARGLREAPAAGQGLHRPWSPQGAILGEESATGIRYVLDPRVVDGTRWITGANIDQKHVHSLVAGRDFAADGYVEVATVRPGDPAPTVRDLSSLRAAWRSATSSSWGASTRTLGLKVLDENGKLVTVTMGSYGIGVTRILAIIAELNNDDKGLIWPASVAPFDVQVVATGRDAAAFELAELSADLDGPGSTCSTTTAPRSPRV
jgi:prolyl-tRNA synthetase